MKFIKKNYILIFSVLILILFIIFFINKNYKKDKIGNNKDIKEIEKYILNIDNYNAKIELKITNNRNENNYTIIQEVTSDIEKQNIIKPDEINGLEIVYQNGKLEIKNTNLNLSKIYENYPNICENSLFLTDFLKKYKNSEEKYIELYGENNIIMTVKTNKNRYDEIEKLYINKNTLKPEKLEVLDNNNNIRVYILYNEIEINI